MKSKRKTPTLARLVTYTGRVIDVCKFSPENVCITDIAHSLSLQSRFLGHGIGYYSVAEHCVLLCEYVAEEFPEDTDLQQWALMHDAAVAYVGDLITPLKAFLPWFSEIKSEIMDAIKSSYGMSDEPAALAALDRRIRADEIAQNSLVPSRYGADFPLGIDLRFYPPAIAEERFLYHFKRLFRESYE